MLLEEFCWGVEGAGAGGGADFFDGVRSDFGGGVAEVVADVGEDRSDGFVVEQAGKLSHGDLPGVFFALDLDWSDEAVEGQLDEALFVA